MGDPAVTKASVMVNHKLLSWSNWGWFTLDIRTSTCPLAVEITLDDGEQLMVMSDGLPSTRLKVAP